MIKRIFIAINLSEQIKKELNSFQTKWPDLPCRWLKQESFHITLGFLGNRNEKELEKIFGTVKEIGEQHNTFSILLNKVCYGPKKIMPPRLVWAEAEKSQEFLRLKKDLDNLLITKINFLPEKRESAPHIALARIKKWDWQRLELEQRPNVNLDINIEIPIFSIDIMESFLKRTGAEYKILLSAPLIARNS